LKFSSVIGTVRWATRRTSIS